jgi:two-component system CheB/CheR fusion protein
VAPSGKSAASDLVVAGVGASAGGLEAFSQLLQSLPQDPGLAIVLVQHLAPLHDSALALLLSGRTNLPVVQATEGMQIERNHLYVIPPNVQMGIENGRLHLMPRPSDRSQYTPIDFFLHSLAESFQDRSIAVILSGTASDGTVGVREVKAVGGITIAQKPETAKYDGMPRAAIATGLVDLVVSPSEIAAELVRIASHPLRHAPSPAPEADEQEEELTGPRREHLEQIFTMLRTLTGVDFRRYKRPTILRRLQRRMVLHKITRVEEYLTFLRENLGEVHALYQDILIHVTRFFREPDSFAAIATHVLPKIVAARRDGQLIRVWVSGCSTGEEAYSVAIVLVEFLGERLGTVPVQIFATDVSEAAIEHGRAGLYSESIVADVSSARLRRFFTKVDGGYRISKTVRDLCIFARQDLTRDPPFSKLDLIVCRNVLIYLGTELQKKLMGLFHYALKPTGFLLLGNAETVGPHTELFAVADKANRIYQKKLAGVPEVHFRIDQSPAVPLQLRRGTALVREDFRTVQAEANRLMQDRYAPPGVIVDDNLRTIQFRGQTGTFLEPAPGDPTLNVLKMAREGLLHELRSALQEARRTKAPARRKAVRVKTNGSWRMIDLEVLPLPAEQPHFLVLFEDPTRGAERPRQRPAGRRREPMPRGRASAQVARLQQELASSREYMQSIIQELEAANEELQSANEEVLSANEELQSTNEELDTAKEELQSTNEELNTVNEELHGRNEELSRLNSDLMNLLGSVQIAIVIVASDLRIRRFTPMAEHVLNLIPGDVGRPIGHIKPNIECPDLEDLIVQVVDTVTPYERNVRDGGGKWYSLRIRPYKNIENRIDGAVLALFELESDRPYEERLKQAQHYVETIVDTVRQPVAILDSTLRVKTANKPFCERFALRPGEVEERHVHELGNGELNIPQLRTLLEDVVTKHTRIEDVELGHEVQLLDGKTILINARRIEAPEGHEALVVLALDIVSDQEGRGRRGPRR